MIYPRSYFIFPSAHVSVWVETVRYTNSSALRIPRRRPTPAPALHTATGQTQRRAVRRGRGSTARHGLSPSGQLQQLSTTTRTGAERAARGGGAASPDPKQTWNRPRPLPNSQNPSCRAPRVPCRTAPVTAFSPTTPRTGARGTSRSLSSLSFLTKRRGAARPRGGVRVVAYQTSPQGIKARGRLRSQLRTEPFFPRRTSSDHLTTATLVTTDACMYTPTDPTSAVHWVKSSLAAWAHGHALTG